jgi:hypothetical protein
MSTVTHPAVSDAMREAVARLPEATYDDLVRACRQTELDNRRLASEIARLTGERDAARDHGAKLLSSGMALTARISAAEQDARWYREQHVAAEAETARLTGERDAANAVVAQLTQGRDNPPVTNGQKVSFSEFLHANARAEAAEAETARLRAALEDAADALGWAASALREDSNDAAAGVTRSAANKASAALTRQEKTDV